jgi:YD repeat-containing protein
VQRVLGSGIHASGLPIGSALWRYNSDFAEWSVSIAGTLGSGRLYGVANAIGGQWEYSRLSVVTATGGKIDITPTPTRLGISAEHRKTVYLAPLDLLPEQSLDWAPAYYRARFDADVRLLPPVQTTASEWNEKRHQLIADKCIDLITRLHRDLATNSSAILVGVTSRDMYIADFDWKYAENLREGSRLAMVSSARLKPTDFPGIWNRELLNSRLQKMITKYLAILYFGLPLSNDYTSLLSAGVLSGSEVDYMTERIVGTKGRWDSLLNPGEPMVTFTASANNPTTWDIGSGGPLDLRTEAFTVDLPVGLFIQRKVDFYLDGDYPLEFIRSYRNADDMARPFGVGANDSLDIFLVGRMGSEIDLITEAGGRFRFHHGDPGSDNDADVYDGEDGRFPKAVYKAGVWRLESNDGWTYLFPYRPNALPVNVTVLTGFIDPKGQKYEMVRNDPGDLLSLTTPSGKWLHFDHDDQHRIRSISDSSGRIVHYEYDAGGRLVRVTQSDGSFEAYTYNDRNEMLAITDGPQEPILVNQYTSNNLIRKQILSDGRQFEYSYDYATQMVIRQNVFKHPNGLYTYFDYGPGGYFQSLPVSPPQ